ncbi:hypothetical protein GCM10010340_56300 [Streptomyces griseoloalbus]|nr:hypothetical protein GCM10010340_56300 [Streptomyces albaduncus]
MPVIDVTDLRKSYGGRAAVDGVSFTVEEGEIFGILGPNGAGKSTTVECVEGLRVPDAGRVRVTGAGVRRGRPGLGAARARGRSARLRRGAARAALGPPRRAADVRTPVTVPRSGQHP